MTSKTKSTPPRHTLNLRIKLEERNLIDMAATVQGKRMSLMFSKPI